MPNATTAAGIFRPKATARPLACVHHLGGLVRHLGRGRARAEIGVGIPRWIAADVEPVSGLVWLETWPERTRQRISAASPTGTGGPGEPPADRSVRTSRDERTWLDIVTVPSPLLGTPPARTSPREPRYRLIVPPFGRERRFSTRLGRQDNRS